MSNDKINDDNLIPSSQQTPLAHSTIPASPTPVYSVPQNIVNAGSNAYELKTDSPESLDQDLKDGSKREQIDPDHSQANSSDYISPTSTIQPLPEDHDTPFSPPTSPVTDPRLEPEQRAPTGVDTTNEVFDNASDIDPHQLYDEGPESAAEVSEPNSNNAVLDYTPPDDTTKE